MHKSQSAASKPSPSDTSGRSPPLGRMLKPRPPKGRNLAQQEADFTAEGAPMPAPAPGLAPLAQRSGAL